MISLASDNLIENTSTFKQEEKANAQSEKASAQSDMKARAKEERKARAEKDEIESKARHARFVEAEKEELAKTIIIPSCLTGKSITNARKFMKENEEFFKDYNRVISYSDSRKDYFKVDRDDSGEWQYDNWEQTLLSSKFKKDEKFKNWIDENDLCRSEAGKKTRAEEEEKARAEAEEKARAGADDKEIN